MLNLKEHLDNCDVFYTCGGDPDCIAELFRRYESTMVKLRQIIRSGQILYIGSCGGACMMSSYYGGMRTMQSSCGCGGRGGQRRRRRPSSSCARRPSTSDEMCRIVRLGWHICVCYFVQMYDHLKGWAGLQSGILAASSARKGLALMAELQRIDPEWLRHHRLGFFLFKFYPKMHQLVHCLEDQIAVHGNPSFFWCYPDASTIGAAIKVAESLHVSKLHTSVLRKHRML